VAKPTPHEIALITQDAWRERVAIEALLDESGPTGGQVAWIRQLDQLPPSAWACWEISRQRGKTWAALLWTLGQMAYHGRSGVYLAQTGGNALAIVSAFVADVEAGLPPEWGLKLDAHGGTLSLCGAELCFFGTDNQQFKRRRGRKADFVLLDEAGFYDDLLDVEQVYVPQLQTTGGRGLYLSSPPISPAHPFAMRCKQAQAASRFVHDTFWSNPRIDHEQVIRGEMARLNLTREELFASTAWRREFLAEEVLEETRAAIPQWNQVLHKRVVGDWTRPAFFDAYTSFDPGKIGDPHFALFAYYDVATSTVTIEDELELRSAVHAVGATAERLKQKESELWGVKAWEGTLLGLADWAKLTAELPAYLLPAIDKRAPRQPYLRVGDNDHLTLNTLLTDFGVVMVPAAKAEKHLAVAKAAELLAGGKVRIHARCRRLIEQLYTTVWNTTRTQWERTPTDHGDAIDCLVYLLRSISWHRDPRPAPPALAPRPHLDDDQPSWENAFTTTVRRRR